MFNILARGYKSIMFNIIREYVFVKHSVYNLQLQLSGMRVVKTSLPGNPGSITRCIFLSLIYSIHQPTISIYRWQQLDIDKNGFTAFVLNIVKQIRSLSSLYDQWPEFKTLIYYKTVSFNGLSWYKWTIWYNYYNFLLSKVVLITLLNISEVAHILRRWRVRICRCLVYMNF